MSQTKKYQKNGIAIIGMSCIFPGAPSLESFWQNIVSGVDAIREPEEKEWDASSYSRRTFPGFGKIYCTRGGFITDYADFDPLEFGIMPASLNGSDPDQFLALRAAADALQDAGYHHKTFSSDRAEVIIGRTMAPGVGSLNLIQHGQTVDQVLDVMKTVAPQLPPEDLQKIEETLHKSLNPCNADTIPAVMPNILAGRIASKLGFRGRSLVLDAACASSLIAVETAIQSLLSGQADIAIAGGVHINSSPYFYQMFSELGALSTSGVIRPFDENADGTILGEGVGMVVLKRLDEAIADKNRIYAVVKGIGSSSDGRGGGSLAPSVEGEAIAMQRAYEMSAVSPDTVELLEAHGTGTKAGDVAEMKAVQKVFGSRVDGKPAWCAIGSIKSMIGHTQAASGMAGLIKAALALHHKTIPPTLNVQKANPQINWDDSPCYINSSAKSWTDENRFSSDSPRRAAVSAFGFGGVNAHVVLEEFASSKIPVKESLGKSPTVEKKTSKTVRLSLKFPAISAAMLEGVKFASVAQQQQPPSFVQLSSKPTVVYAGRATSQNPPTIKRPISASVPQDSEIKESNDEQSRIMQGYFQLLGSFHQSMLGVQENVMRTYLNNDGNS